MMKGGVSSLVDGGIAAFYNTQSPGMAEVSIQNEERAGAWPGCSLTRVHVVQRLRRRDLFGSFGVAATARGRAVLFPGKCAN